MKKVHCIAQKLCSQIAAAIATCKARCQLFLQMGVCSFIAHMLLSCTSYAIAYNQQLASYSYTISCSYYSMQPYTQPQYSNRASGQIIYCMRQPLCVSCNSYTASCINYNGSTTWLHLCPEHAVRMSRQLVANQLPQIVYRIYISQGGPKLARADQFWQWTDFFIAGL